MTTHAICDACECVSHCSKNGCVPLTPIFRAPSVGCSGETVERELLAEVEAQYIELADIHNDWPGRHTMKGQQKLCRLRDLICKATGREARDVQDDYSNRSLVATGETS